MEKSELFSYAMDLTSYLVLKVEGINRIILYGSVARGDFNEDSDIDLFIDSINRDIKKKIDKVLDNYYKTKKFKEWQLKGIDNSFSIIAGALDGKEWSALKRALLNEGIVLYGKYMDRAENMRQYALFSFENIKPDKKRVAIFRALFGFKLGNKQYEGLVKKINGLRIGKGTILISTTMANELKRYFHEKKVNVKIYDVWSDDI